VGGTPRFGYKYKSPLRLPNVYFFGYGHSFSRRGHATLRFFGLDTWDMIARNFMTRNPRFCLAFRLKNVCFGFSNGMGWLHFYCNPATKITSGFKCPLMSTSLPIFCFDDDRTFGGISVHPPVSRSCRYRTLLWDAKDLLSWDNTRTENETPWLKSNSLTPPPASASSWKKDVLDALNPHYNRHEVAEITLDNFTIPSGVRNGMHSFDSSEF
jgi:hypothetical protein